MSDTNKYSPVWLWADVVRSLNGCFQQFSRNYSLELVVIACDAIVCESTVKGTLGGVMVILEDILPRIHKNPRSLEHIVKFLTSSVESAHDKESETVQNLIIALGNLLKSNTVKALKHFIYIQVGGDIDALLKPHSSIFLNERAQFDLSNFSEEVKKYSDSLRDKAPEFVELEEFYVQNLDPTLKLIVLGKMNALDAKDLEFVRNTIPQLLAFQTNSPTFTPLSTLDSLLDILLTCKPQSPDMPCTELVEYILPYLLEKARVAEIPDDARPIVLWKLIAVSCDIVSNNERETFMGVVDALMNELTHVLIKGDYNFVEAFVKATDIVRRGASINNASALTSIVQYTIPSLIDELKQFPAMYKEQILLSTLRYVAFSITSHSPSAFLNQGFQAVVTFVNYWKHRCSDDKEVCDIFIASLEVAQLLVSQNVQAESMAQFFVHYIPDSFSKILNWYETQDPNVKRPDSPDLPSFVLRILYFWHECTKNNVNRYKVFVLYLPPIYENVFQISDAKCKTTKVKLLYDVLGILVDQMKKGIKVSEFLSDGMPVLLNLGRDLELDCDNVLKLFSVMVDRLESNSSFELLFKLHHSYRFAIEHFQAKKEINLFYLNLIKKAKRQDISSVNELMRSEALTPRYAELMSNVLGLNTKNPPLAARDLNVAIDILVSLMKITKPVLVDVPKDEQDVIFPILDGVIQRMNLAIANGTFSKESKQIPEVISRVIMFRTLFKSDLPTLQGKNQEEISAEFASKFPIDVVQNPKIMSGLMTLSRRIDNTRAKYNHVITFAVECVHKFLDNSHPLLAECENDKQKVALRKKILQDFIFEHPKNVEIRERLKSLGYGENLWKDHIAILVETECRRNLEGNFKVSLQGLYGEYVDILKNLDIKTVEIEGSPINAEKVFEPATFAEILGIEELRARRAAVVRTIDAALAQITEAHPNFAFRKNYESRKFSLLSREERLESEFNRSKIALEHEVPKRQTYRIRLNNTFFTNVQTCDNNIVGCYAPDGDHSEKPIECGIKACSAIISLFVHDDKGGEPNEGLEMENVEVLFTDQGMYMYKLYTNGHPFDTSRIWASFLRNLIKEGYVPAIIIPKKFPSPSLYNLVCKYIPEQIVGCVLNYKDDFFSEEGVETYYDFKPEKIKAGDVVITEGNVRQLKVDPSESAEETTKMKQTMLRSSADLGALGARLAVPVKRGGTVQQDKDLSGTIVSEVMLILKKDPELAKYSAVLSAFGRFISQFINTLIEKGTEDVTILSKNFDVELWNRRHSLPTEILTYAEMEQITQKIQQEVEMKMLTYYDITNLQALLRTKPAHFFEVKSHLEVAKPTGVIAPRSALLQVRSILLSNMKVVKIADFDSEKQVEIMKWIFKNEDKVWRDRGGRPGEETLASFLKLIDPKPQHAHAPMPGFVAYNAAQSAEVKIGENIIGYTIGEFVKEGQYEVITTWVDTKYKGLTIAVQLYKDVFVEVWKHGAKLLECDVLAGSVARIYSSSVVGPLFKFGLGPIVITQLRNSYTSTALTGEEQFMKVMLRVWPVVMCARISNLVNYFRRLLSKYIRRIDTL